MGHTFFPWNLCYRESDHWTVLATEKEYTLADSGPIGVQVVRCELDRRPNQKCQITWKEQ